MIKSVFCSFFNKSHDYDVSAFLKKQGKMLIIVEKSERKKTHTYVFKNKMLIKTNQWNNDKNVTVKM